MSNEGLGKAEKANNNFMSPFKAMYHCRSGTSYPEFVFFPTGGSRARHRSLLAASNYWHHDGRFYFVNVDMENRCVRNEEEIG